MGNRAVITAGTTPASPCIYLHWNGGYASVLAFLKAAKDLGIRRMPWNNAGQARAFDAIAAVVAGPFFGCDVGRTVYRETYGETDTNNHDNGVYVIDERLNICDRLFTRLGREEVDPAKTSAVYEQIMARAPVFNGEL